MRQEGTFGGWGASIGDVGDEDCAPERLCPLDENKAERVAIDLGDETRLADRRRKRTAHEAQGAGVVLRRVVVIVGNGDHGQQQIGGKEQEAFRSGCFRHLRVTLEDRRDNVEQPALSVTTVEAHEKASLSNFPLEGRSPCLWPSTTSASDSGA